MKKSRDEVVFFFFQGGLEGLSEQRPERSEGESHVDIWEENFRRRKEVRRS